jgi:hypothetical protein
MPDFSVTVTRAFISTSSFRTTRNADRSGI